MAGRALVELQFANGRLVRTTGDRRYLGEANVNIADWERNPLVALNTANAQDGARIEIPAGTVVDVLRIR